MSESWSAGRLVLLAAGLVLMGTGAVVGLTSIPSEEWPSVLLWLAGGVAVHDAVLAPVAVLLGLVVLPRVPERWRAPLRGGALGAGVLAVVAVAVVAGAANRRNPSVVPLDPVVALSVSAAVLVLSVLLGVLGQRVLASRASRTSRTAAGRGPQAPPPQAGDGAAGPPG